MKKVFASIVAVLALTSTAYAGGEYKVDVKAPSSAKKGEKATAKLHIEARATSTSTRSTRSRSSSPRARA